MKKRIVTVLVAVLVVLALVAGAKAYWSLRRAQTLNMLCQQLRDRAAAEWPGGSISGHIVFQDADWAAVAHRPDRHSGFDPIGDMAVVLKSDGQMLMHHYHYCGLEGLGGFLQRPYSNWQHFVTSHRDSGPWEPVKQRSEQPSRPVPK